MKSNEEINDIELLDSMAKDYKLSYCLEYVFEIPIKQKFVRVNKFNDTNFTTNPYLEVRRYKLVKTDDYTYQWRRLN